jgi:hypothetical protein
LEAARATMGDTGAALGKTEEELKALRDKLAALE